MASKRVGKIYKIKVNKDFYIGSTWDFDDRLKLHTSKSKSKNYKLYKAIRDNNNKFEMILLYEYECYTDEELRIEERRCYDELKPNLNSQRPSVSKEEYVEDKKQQYSKYKDSIKKYNKQYCIENKEYILEKEKERRDNKKYICGCGSRVLNQNWYITKHEQTQRHQKYLLEM